MVRCKDSRIRIEYRSRHSEQEKFSMNDEQVKLRWEDLFCISKTITIGTWVP